VIKVDEHFIRIFKQNKEYLEKRKPLNQKLQSIEEIKKAIMAKIDSLESDIMKEISDIHIPDCTHDICLHVKLNDNYMEEVFACVSCDSFMIEKDPNAHIFEIEEEMSTKELKTLLCSIRDLIESKLVCKPNITIEEIIEIIDGFVNFQKGNGRK